MLIADLRLLIEACWERGPGGTNMGRPRLPAGKAKSRCILFRLAPPLHKAMSGAAKREGLPVGTRALEQAAKALRSK